MSFFKPKTGDVFEFDHGGLLRYFQFLYRSVNNVPLIRYFLQGFSSQPDLNEFVDMEESGMIQCDFVVRKWAKENQIRFIGNVPIPERLKEPPKSFLDWSSLDFKTIPPSWMLISTDDEDKKCYTKFGYHLPAEYLKYPDSSIFFFLGLKDIYDRGCSNNEYTYREWPEERVCE